MLWEKEGDRLKYEAGLMGKFNFGLQIYGFFFAIVTLVMTSMLKMPKNDVCVAFFLP